MLDPNVLAQLSQLKTDIEASKDYAEGTVAATSGRYGFVRTDDSRDVFLSPEKMDKLLPGDRVKICVNQNDKGKLEATLEKLISSELKKFVGQYRVKGAGHFVVPDGPQFSRWIFVPPAQRKGAKDGDLVVAKMSRHPYKDGKAQANIVFRIGQPTDAHIEHKYTKAKHDLNYRSNDSQQKQIQDIQASFNPIDQTGRDDLRDVGFVTIDSANTLDMDDALFIEKTDGGFKLVVAIADPGSYIDPNSSLAAQARDCGQSVYLLGGTVPMLPAPLSHQGFSLEEGKDKPALVITLHIDAQGKTTESHFASAVIRSKHKLSYDQVALFLSTQDADSVPADSHDLITTLGQFAELRRQFREQHYLVSDDHVDYDHELDSQGHIVNITLRERNCAHLLVEEAMVAVNIAAGEFLKQQGTGIHSVHHGFRSERIGEVKALLKEESIATEGIDTYTGHVALIKQLAADDDKKRLIPALRRMMQASELSVNAAPHLGMGVAHYATITSPIRRFADLYNHWCIKTALNPDSPKAKANDDSLAKLNETLRVGRVADRELQQWLTCQFTQTLIGSEGVGTIRIVTQQGFGVKLTNNGVEGFVLFGKKVEKRFDAKRMTLTVGETTYRMGDEVSIKIVSVDMDKRRVAFELAEAK